jgi:AcrR family transcriptional regulator
MSPRHRVTSDKDILAATRRVVSRLGPNLTLAAVGMEAGVSPATLLQRFESKRGLLLALAASTSAGLGAEFERIRAAYQSPLAAIYGVADCMATVAGTPETLANSLVFLHMDLGDPAFREHALAHASGVHAEIKALLDEAIEGGELPACDTTQLARTVQALIGGSLLLWAIDRQGELFERLSGDLDALLRPRG